MSLTGRNRGYLGVIFTVLGLLAGRLRCQNWHVSLVAMLNVTPTEYDLSEGSACPHLPSPTAT